MTTDQPVTDQPTSETVEPRAMRVHVTMVVSSAVPVTAVDVEDALESYQDSDRMPGDPTYGAFGQASVDGSQWEPAAVTDGETGEELWSVDDEDKAAFHAVASATDGLFIAPTAAGVDTVWRRGPVGPVRVLDATEAPELWPLLRATLSSTTVPMPAEQQPARVARLGEERRPPAVLTLGSDAVLRLDLDDERRVIEIEYRDAEGDELTVLYAELTERQHETVTVAHSTGRHDILAVVPARLTKDGILTPRVLRADAIVRVSPF